MQTIDELLDAAKARHGIGSDYKLAMFLGIGEANIRSYRKGRSLPDATMCARLADALGVDPLPLIASMEAQRATTAEARALWERIALRLTPAALAAVVALPVLLVASPDAGASPVIVMSNGMAVALSLAIASCASWLIRARRALT